jgi:glycosyl hydrolase family 31
MHWEGPQIDRPNERPYALHRNGYAGMQRYASFLWSGDVYSTWETLKTQVPIAINTSLTGIPYWVWISEDSFRRPSSALNSTYDGFNSGHSALCSALTGVHGNFVCLGAGTLETRVSG